MSYNIGSAQLVLNEISSVRGYKDVNGKDCDWIEVVNIGNGPINLSNYFVSDKLNNLTKWNFSEEQLDYMEHMLILCSGLDKKNRVRDWQSIINKSSEWFYLLGLLETDSNWNSILYNDSAWSMGYMGFGLGDNDDSTHISGVSSFYLRTHFNILDKFSISNLILHADYDDAFIAYINDVEIARSKNIYSQPAYNTLAASGHEALIYRNMLHEKYIINNALIDSILRIGDNVLSIQIHDIDSIPNDMSASFFLYAGINSDSTYFHPKTNWFEDTITFYHTNFKISDNDTIYISDSLGNILDQKAISTDRSLISEGRFPSGIGSWCYFDSPSPGISNDSNWCYNGIVEEPSVSLSSGWYQNAEYITIEVLNNSNIYYTVNGNVPDTNDYEYTDTLWIDTTTVLSVRAFGSNNLLPSKVIDRTYIFNEDNFGLPVFSIITDSLNLWDWNTGIYVLGPDADPNEPNSGANFRKPWSKWSRLEFFDKTKDKQAEEEFDLEIHGGWSRCYPQKSFRLDFKSRYTGDLEYTLLSQRPNVNNFNNINLRNGGGWPGLIDRIRDGFLCKIASETNVDIMAYEPCVVYLNGRYWGQYGIREKIDEYYLESNHNVTSDSVDLLNANSILSGSDMHFVESYHQIINTNPNSSIFYNLIDKRFDLDNYIDYFILQTYIQNRDWFAGINNIKLWRENNEHGKWRYVLFDTDQTFLYDGTWDYLDLARNPYRVSGLDTISCVTKHSELFNHILKNDEFECLFISRYAELVNTIFDSVYFAQQLDSMKFKVQDAIPTHINRWGTPSSYSFWETRLHNLKQSNRNRANYALEHVKQQFNLGGIISLSLNVIPNNSGKIKINNITPKSYYWHGKFFINTCSSKVLALADSGYIFSHWSSNHIIGDQIYSDFIDLSFSQDDTITAHFRECKINNLELFLDSTDNILIPTFDIGYGPFLYQWFFDNDTVFLAEDSIFSPKKTGMYSVSVTDKDGCNTVSPSIFFDCNILVEADLMQDTITNSLNVSCTGGTQPYSYQWFIDSILVENIDKVSLDIYTYGTYYAIIEDINGCKSFTETIRNKKLEVNIFPRTF